MVSRAVSEAAAPDVAELIERTLGRFLQLHELHCREVDEVKALVADLGEAVAQLGLNVSQSEAATKSRVAELAQDVAECERRLTHVHQKALRALTHQHAGGKPE